MRKRSEVLAIAVMGGPAPGINGVIGAVTIEAINEGLDVIGIMDGFKWLSRGDTSFLVPLSIENVSRIHFTGGSILRSSRDNPIDSRDKIENLMKSFSELRIKYLVTIGGDGTATLAYKLKKLMGDRIRIAHVPKTIDNDIPLPENMPTFGFETAKELGTDLVRNIMEDSKTTNRWYFVITMGREAGHLALGIAKAAGATLAVIPEELKGDRVPLHYITDILEGAIIKRKALGREDGVAVIAEGIALKIDPHDLPADQIMERDDFGHLRLSEIPLGKILKDPVLGSLRKRGVDIKILDVEIGYILRSAPPIAFDIEYTKNLGHGAVEYLLNMEGSGAIISYKGGRLNPIPFEELIDPETERLRVRFVDTTSETYRVSQEYMIKLKKEDFESPEDIEELARAGNMSPEDFINRFKYLVD